MITEPQTQPQENSPTFALLMDLSRPIPRSGELVLIVQKKIIQQFGEEYETSLKAIILQNPRQALAFLNNSVLVNKISTQTLTLEGQLTVTFTSAPRLPTEYVDLNFPQGPQHLSLQDLQALTTTHIDPHSALQCLMFFRKSSVLVRLPSPTFASRIEKDLLYLPGAQSTHLVTLNDHCCLDCWWFSPIPLGDVVNKLKRTGETLCGVLQGIFALMPEQPCLLDLAIKEIFPSPTGNPEMILICCTSRDVEIIRNSGSIDVGPVGKIGFNQSALDNQRKSDSDTDSRSSSDTSEESTVPDKDSHGDAFRDCFVFWDVDTCPIPREISHEKLQRITKNLETVLRLSGMELARNGLFIFLTDSSFQVRANLQISFFLFFFLLTFLE
jgi:hypothetical protein